jgi:hypothetical protein
MNTGETGLSNDRGPDPCGPAAAAAQFGAAGLRLTISRFISKV